MPQPRLRPRPDATSVAKRTAEAEQRTETALRHIMLRLDLQPPDPPAGVDPNRPDLAKLGATEGSMRIIEDIRDALVQHDIDVAHHWRNLR